MRLITSVCALAVTALGLANTAQALNADRCWPRHGGNGGGAYFTGWTLGSFIQRIDVWHGQHIDAFQVTWCHQRSQDQIICEIGDRVGGPGGGHGSFSLDWRSGERIVEVRGRSGKYVDGLQFRTNFGRVSPWFGGSGGAPFSDVIGFGFVNDFWGTAGKFVDSLGPCSVF